jgi:tail tube protein
MPIPSGLSAQFGVAEETTYGTPVTPTRFYEFTKETLKQDIKRIESAGLRAGTRIQRSDRWVPGVKSVGGVVTMELADRSFGLWWKHALGSVASAQPDAGGNPTVWRHTFTPGDLPVGLTAQVGRTGMDSTTRAFTYHGCRVNEWELEASAGKPATLAVTLLGEDEETDTALAVAAYPANLGLMTFVSGSILVAGAGIDVKEINLSGNNNLASDRYFFGSRLRKQPTDNGMREYTGEIKSEFHDLVAYNRFVTGTEAALVLLFEGSTISGAFKFHTQITANVRFDGETPTVEGPETIEQSLPFKCLGNAAATAISVQYQTTDSAP